MVVIIWTFKVIADKRAVFEEHYNSDGTWATFFKQGQGYLGTDLAYDDELDLYATLDRWRSISDFNTFSAQNRQKYKELDTQFENFTIAETFIGHFVVNI